MNTLRLPHQSSLANNDTYTSPDGTYEDSELSYTENDDFSDDKTIEDDDDEDDSDEDTDEGVENVENNVVDKDPVCLHLILKLY